MRETNKQRREVTKRFGYSKKKEKENKKKSYRRSEKQLVYVIYVSKKNKLGTSDVLYKESYVSSPLFCINSIRTLLSRKEKDKQMTMK